MDLHVFFHDPNADPRIDQILGQITQLVAQGDTMALSMKDIQDSITVLTDAIAAETARIAASLAGQPTQAEIAAAKASLDNLTAAVNAVDPAAPAGPVLPPVGP